MLITTVTATTTSTTSSAAAGIMSMTIPVGLPEYGVLAIIALIIVLEGSVGDGITPAKARRISAISLPVLVMLVQMVVSTAVAVAVIVTSTV